MDVNTKSKPNGNGKQQKPHAGFGTPGRAYRFDPRPGITSSEVMELLEFAITGMMVASGNAPPQALHFMYDNLTIEAKRHLIVQERSPIVLAKP